MARELALHSTPPFRSLLCSTEFRSRTGWVRPSFCRSMFHNSGLLLHNNTSPHKSRIDGRHAAGKWPAASVQMTCNFEKGASGQHIPSLLTTVRSSLLVEGVLRLVLQSLRDCMKLCSHAAYIQEYVGIPALRNISAEFSSMS